jgi:putative oxidoreductase
MEYLFLLSRILFGGFWIYNGINHFRMGNMMEGYAAMKGVPMPKYAVYGSGLLIILGGLGILLGAYTQLSVAALVIFLIPVTLMMHNFWRVSEPNQRMTDMVMFMKNTALLGASLAYLFIPAPWPLSFF